MRYAVRIVGVLSWLAAVGLTIKLVHDFTDGQSYVVVGVAMLAIVMSSFGLLLARYSWERRAFPEIALGMAMWCAGVIYLTTTELGYWASTYDSRHEQFMTAKKAHARHEGITDRAFQALITGNVTSPAQLEALIARNKLDPAYSRAKQCTEVTTPASRKLCGEIFTLQAKLAEVTEQKQLESRLDTTEKVAVVATTMNIFAQAEMLSRWLGGTERGWSDFITVSGWLVLMLIRDAGLLVANPLGRRQDRAAATKAPEATETPLKVYPPVQRAARGPVVPWIELPTLTPKGIGLPPHPPKPDDTPPPGDAKPVTEDEADHVADVRKMVPPAAATYPKLVTDDWNQPPVTPRTKAERLEAIDVITKRWLAQGTVIRAPFNLAVPIYEDYARFCRQYGVKPVNNSHFGRSLRRLKIATKKKAKGIHYGLKLVARPRHRNRTVAAIAA